MAGDVQKCPKFSTPEDCEKACDEIGAACNAFNYRHENGKCCFKSCPDVYDISLLEGHGENFVSFVCRDGNF